MEIPRLADATQAELAQLSVVEKKAGIRVGDLAVPASAGVHIGGRNFIYTLVPMSGGASGAAPSRPRSMKPWRS